MLQSNNANRLKNVWLETSQLVAKLVLKVKAIMLQSNNAIEIDWRMYD